MTKQTKRTPTTRSLTTTNLCEPLRTRVERPGPDAKGTSFRPIPPAWTCVHGAMCANDASPELTARTLIARPVGISRRKAT